MLFAVEKLCKKLNYTGIGMFEFKFNETIQEWILIEVNARFWGSLPLAIYAGVDFPKLYAQVLLGLKAQNKLTYKIPAYGRSLSSDIYDMKNEFDVLRDKAGLKTASAKAIKRLISFGNILLGREKIDSFSWKDSGPFGSEVYQLIEGKVTRQRFVSAHQKRKRIEQLKLVLRKPIDNVFFVCYGNIMRSPFAEHLFRDKLNKQNSQHDFEIDSFGFHQITERRAKAESIEVAQKWGINLEPHRSKLLTATHIDNKTLIVIFDKKNEYFLNAFYPAANVVYLADLVDKTKPPLMEISDPYGHTEATLMDCYRQIDNGLDSLLQMMDQR